jgi:ADP-ribose pyrophosphatase YjhB (NUDIX family)
MTEKIRTKLIVYLLVRQRENVCLVKYRRPPNPTRGGWWIPAPELAYGEHPDDCARRILVSLGMVTTAPRLAGVDSFVTRDWHVLFYYTADYEGVSGDEGARFGDEYEQGAWFPLDRLPAADDLAHGDWERALILRLAALT